MRKIIVVLLITAVFTAANLTGPLVVNAEDCQTCCDRCLAEFNVCLIMCELSGGGFQYCFNLCYDEFTQCQAGCPCCYGCEY